MRQQPLKETQAADPSTEPSKPSEWEKLKQMNRGDRVWYIWAYYKFHIFAIIAVLFLLYVVGSSVYRSTFETALHCIYVNSRSESDISFAPLEDDFSAWLGLGKKDVITTESIFISFGSDATDFSYANMAKISALVAARDLDVLICDQESLDHYADLSGFMDLEQSLPADMLDLVRDRLYFCPGPDGVSHAYAIDLTGTDFVSRSRLAQTPPLLGIVASSERTETAVALIRYIFAPQT